MNSFGNNWKKIQSLITTVRNYFKNHFFTSLLQVSPLQSKYNCAHSSFYCKGRKTQTLTKSSTYAVEISQGKNV